VRRGSWGSQPRGAERVQGVKGELIEAFEETKWVWTQTVREREAEKDVPRYGTFAKSVRTLR